MAEAKKDPTRITLGSKEHPVRYSYLHAFEPKENDKGEKFYQAMILIPKTDTAAKAAIDAAIKAVRDEKLGPKPTPPTWKMPLRDGDLEADEKGEHMKGHWFFNCKSKTRPQVVGTEKDEFTNKLKALDSSELKSGDYGRVSVNFYYFETESKGVGVGLGNIQKLKDGDPLGNQRSADDDFGDLEDGFAD